MQRTLRQPGFWLAFGLMAMVMAIQGVIGAALQLVGMVLSRGKNSGLGIANDPLALAVINLFSIGATIAVGLLINRLPWRQAFPKGMIRFGAWLSLPIIGVGAAILLSEADNFFRYVCPPPEFIAKFMEELFLAKGRFLSMFFLLVIVAPLSEELLFRGIILRGLLRRYRPVVAILLSSLLFALMHLNPWQTISAFTLGLIFGWFFLRTGSVWPGVVGHAINNFIALIMNIAPFGWWEVPTDVREVEFQPWWLDLMGVGLFGLGVYLFRKQTPELPDIAEELRPLKELPPIISNA